MSKNDESCCPCTRQCHGESALHGMHSLSSRIELLENLHNSFIKDTVTWTLERQESFSIFDKRLDACEQNYPSLWKKIEKTELDLEKERQENYKVWQEIIYLKKINDVFPHHFTPPEKIEEKIKDILSNIEKVKNLYLTQEKRIREIEDLFQGKSFKPIHDAMEYYIEDFNRRITELKMVCESMGDMISSLNERIFPLLVSVANKEIRGE